MGVARAELVRLVEALPEKAIPVAKKFLEFLLQQKDDAAFIAAFHAAPEDDEPLTDEEMQAIEEGLGDISEGRVEPWEQARMDLCKS